MTTPQILTVENSSAVFGDIPRPSLVPEFKFLNEIPKGEAETFLIYGPSGSGKTWFSGTAGSRTLFIDNGNGITTLQSPLFQKMVASNPIVVSLYEKLGARGMFETADVYNAICDTLDYALEKFKDNFDTVVIDDATHLRKGAMNRALEINQATGKSKTLKDSKEKHDIVSPAIQDFGTEMNLVEQFIAGYTTICKEAGKHLILNAHERLTYRKGDKTGDPPMLAKTSPGFTGQTFPDTVPAYFDHVWYMQVVGSGSNRVWRATTQGHETLSAKTRMGGVFETLEANPNFLDCIKRIRESSPDKVKAKK